MVSDKGRRVGAKYKNRQKDMCKGDRREGKVENVKLKDGR